MNLLTRIFTRPGTAIHNAASVMAKLGAEQRQRTFKERRDETTHALRKDIAAGRIAKLGWKA